MVLWLIVLKPIGLQLGNFMDLMIQPFQWKNERILAYSIGQPTLTRLLKST
jgi:hypothetical protein